MRHESSTVVALVGRVSGALLADLAESSNVSVVRVPAGERSGEEQQPAPRAQLTLSAPTSGSAGTGEATRQAWEPGALAMRAAAQRHATYVVVPDDPLAGVAGAWRAMWDVSAEPGASVRFEEAVAETLAAWQAKRFELPDYYLVVAPAQDSPIGPDLYLGPLRAARPRRVAVALGADRDNPGGLSSTAGLLHTLRTLEQGPWWPPLDELVDAARRFYAGGLAESQQAPV